MNHQSTQLDIKRVEPEVPWHVVRLNVEAASNMASVESFNIITEELTPVIMYWRTLYNKYASALPLKTDEVLHIHRTPHTLDNAL